MPAAQYKKPNRLKIILLLIVVITLSTIFIVYLGSRRISKAPELTIAPIQDGADMSIGKIHQTATRDGRKEWSLEANSAHYNQTKKQVILKDLAMTFFLEDDSKVYLTADQGILDSTSNDVEVSGNIVIKKDPFILTTEKLSYRHASRIIFTHEPVTVSGNSAEISADSASLDLNTKKIVLEGKVEGTIAEDFTL